MAQPPRPSLASRAKKFVDDKVVHERERRHFEVLFNAVDANHDKKLTPAELAKFVASLLPGENPRSQRMVALATDIATHMDVDDENGVDVTEFTNFLVVIAGTYRCGATEHRLATEIDMMEAVRSYFLCAAGRGAHTEMHDFEQERNDDDASRNFV